MLYAVQNTRKRGVIKAYKYCAD